jgi:predicted ATPase
LLVTLVGSLERQGIAWDTLIDVEEALGEVPQSLHGMVEQQLTQCRAAERQVLEAASVAGVEFAAASVSAALLATGEGTTIEAVCEELVRREQFLTDQGLLVWPDGTITQKFGFRHALYREVLYSHVAEARRVRMHRAIGEQLESGYAGHTEQIAGELAEHFANGRDDAKAVTYHQLAAEVALKRSAPREAIRHLTQGLAAVERLPASLAQARHDLQLHTRLGAALIAAHGYSAPEVEHAYARAWEMCQQMEDDSTLIPVLCGLWRFYTGRADLPRATKLATQFFTLTQQQQEPGLLLVAHSILGQTRLFLGELAAAQVHVDHNLALYEARAHRSLIEVYGEDPGVVCRGYGAGVKWLLGALNQSRQLLDEGLQLAQDLGHPECMAQQLWAGAFRYQWCGDVDKVHELTQRLLGLNPDEISPVWRAGCTFLQGWVWIQREQMSEGMAQMRQGLDDWRATGMVLYQPYFLALLAEALREKGRITEGLEVLAEALTLVEKTKERWYEAELYRLQGELILQAWPVSNPHSIPRVKKAEACFRKALDIARQQEAKSLELRAATSLARLWQSQGERDEARESLGEIYGWFTDGFDTADLKDANSLLNELS